MRVAEHTYVIWLGIWLLLDCSLKFYGCLIERWSHMPYHFLLIFPVEFQEVLVPYTHIYFLIFFLEILEELIVSLISKFWTN
jgi:hypothetical protein